MKRWFSVFLLVAMMMSLFSLSVNAGTDDTLERYQYPIVPGTDKWEEFQSLDEMIAACQIPQNVLNKMSTDALIDAVVNYPLAVNVFAYETPKEGVEHIKAYFNGLQELAKRNNVTQLMGSHVKKLEQQKSGDFVEESFAKAVYEMLISEKSNKTPGLLRYDTHSNYTPNGSRI